LQAEVSCPICLDYLRGAVTTERGHNFCHSHIQQCWEDLQDTFPCPVCLQPCPEKSFRRNSQSCLMIDVVKNLPSTEDMRKWQKEKPLCEKHKQVLSLFCEKDLELLCPQRKLKSYIQPLKKQLEDAEKVLEMQVSKSFELVWKVENQRSDLHSNVEHFKHFWGMEHDEIHVKLLNEENDVQDKIIEKRTQISDKGYTLKSLLDEITKKCLQSDLDLLTGIERIHSISEGFDAGRHFWQVEGRGMGEWSFAIAAGEFNSHLLYLALGIQETCVRLAFFCTMSWEKFLFTV
ncbi:hypothetical protein EI555_002594, partial [Monodon monoceros]